MTLADGVEVAHGTLNPIAQVRSLVRQPPILPTCFADLNRGELEYAPR